MLIKAYIGFLSLQLFAVGALPWQPFEPWNRILEALTVAAITLLAWIATDGRRPVLVVGGAMLLAFAAEASARLPNTLDFLAGALAAFLTGALLLTMKGKSSCAESSPR